MPEAEPESEPQPRPNRTLTLNLSEQDIDFLTLKAQENGDEFDQCLRTTIIGFAETFEEVGDRLGLQDWFDKLDDTEMNPLAKAYKPQVPMQPLRVEIDAETMDKLENAALIMRYPSADLLAEITLSHSFNPEYLLDKIRKLHRRPLDES